MTQKRVKKSPITENFHHAGLIVQDVDRVAEYYESLGIGPFEPLTLNVTERKFRGKPIVGVQLKIRMAHVGSTRIELIQPVVGEGPWRDFLDHHGEGCAHLAFVVDDIDKAVGEMLRRGMNIVYQSKFADGGAAAYLESDKIGGIMLELFQRPNDYVAHKKK